jgi:hypothetical protein
LNPFPSDKILKRMGYFDDQEGIVRRFINEGSNWTEHIKNTKDFIEKFVSKTKNCNVAVLGSVWMLDVPLEYLAENCNHVYLFDIRHPRQIIHRYRQLKNISFICQDVTGGTVEEVYNIMDTRKPDYDQLNNLERCGFSTSEPIDLVVSVNILNQLDILVLEYIRKFRIPEHFSTNTLRSTIQEAHIQSLKEGISCIISDYEEILYDKSDNLAHSNSLLFTKLPDGAYKAEWIWKFDTQMTYYPNYKTFFKVLAIQL